MLNLLSSLVGNLINSWYLNLGYAGIVLAMAIESCCIPLPSEIVMPTAGFFVFTYPDRFSLLGVAIAGTIGCVIGSAAAYWIGRAGGRPLLMRYGRYVLISQADSDRADRLFARHGNSVTFFSRLLPVVRTYISLPAGIAEMNFWRFLLYTALGSLPWCLVLAYAGTKVGEHSKQLTTVFHGLDIVILVVIVAAVGLYVWRHIRHDRAARAAAATSATNASQPPAASFTRRPKPVPSSPLELPERPTVPDLTSVPTWPNRYARPASSGDAKGDAPSSGDQRESRA